MLHMLNFLASLEVKFEQSVLEYRELRATSSSYSFSYHKDVFYSQRTVAKIASYATAAKIFHLDGKCVDVPALTHIVELDLTDVHRAYEADQLGLAFFDCSTTLSLTNPSFNVFYDQLSFLLSAAGKRDSRPQLKTPFYTKYLPFFSRLRKTQAKIVIVDTKATLHSPPLDGTDFERKGSQNVITNAEIQQLSFKTSSKDLGRLIQQMNTNISSATPLTIKGFTKIKNLNIEVDENRLALSSLGVLIGYCVNTNRIAVRVQSKRLQVKSVNTMIVHVVRKVQDSRIKKECAQKQKQATDPQKQTGPLTEGPEELYDLFSFLPSIIYSLSFHSSCCQVTVICDEYLSSHKIYDKRLEQEIDLGSFKRGISFFITDFAADSDREEVHVGAGWKEVQVRTMSDYSSE